MEAVRYTFKTEALLFLSVGFAYMGDIFEDLRRHAPHASPRDLRIVPYLTKRYPKHREPLHARELEI